MGLRTSELLALSTQEQADPALILAAADVNFQVGPETLQKYVPGGDPSDPRDTALAGIRYLKELQGLGLSPARVGAQYNHGADWEAKAVDQAKKNPGAPLNIIVDGNNFEVSYQKFKDQLGAGGNSAIAEPTGSQFTAPKTLTAISDAWSKMNDDLYGAMSKASGAMSKYEDKAKTLTQKYDGNINELLASIVKGGDLDAGVVLANSAVEAEKGLQSAVLLNDFGIDRDAVDNVIGRTANRMRVAKETSDVMLAELQRRDQISFFNDPFGWINHQLTKGPDIAAYNAQVDTFNKGSRDLAVLDARFKDLRESNLTKFSNQRAAAAVAASEAVKNAALIKAGTVKELAIRHDLDMASSEIQRLVSHAQLLQTAANSLSVSESRDERIKAERLKQESADSSFKAMQIAAGTLGLTLTSPNDLKGMRPDQLELLKRLMLSGGTNYGDSPTEAMQNVALGNRNLQPREVRVVADFANQALAKVRNDVASNAELKLAMPTGKKLVELYDQKVLEIFYDWQKNVDLHPIPGRPENLYHSPTAKVMIDDPDVSKTQLGMNLRKQMEAAPSFVPTDQQIVKIVKDGIQSGEYKGLEEGVRDLEKYFRAVIQQNNRSLHLDRWSLPPQVAYGFAVGDGSGLTDFADYAAIAKRMSKLLGADVLKTMDTTSIVPGM